ncbi:MAG: N-acetyl-gamma-glutamyl-phosphate reductase [Clostridia bacterium]|nr:N-acetyl-gamma-glutamyl-phosphate reductase [Clostridia bacterium]
MISVGIVGANGYTGFELMRLLACHPSAKVTLATSRSLAGQKVADTYPTLRGAYGDMVYSDVALEKLAQDCDVVFACLPHGQSADICGKLIDLGAKVIDLSADYRYDDLGLYEKTYKLTHPRPDLASEAVYGLPEYNRKAIAGARLIGNPGCYVTASVLAIKPLVDAGVINPKTVIVDAKSGVSGAGRKADVAYNANEVSESFKAYGVTTHRHTTEIEEKSGAVVTFTPHLLPVHRGILATIYCDLTATAKDVEKAYSRYDGEQFVHYLGNKLPEIKTVAGSNCCYIGTAIEEKTGRLIVVSCIDNLIKGASGQAIQNMNVMFGLDESAGLPKVGFHL